MEEQLRQLTEQVKKYLTDRHLADPDPYAVYHDFFELCRQAEVEEDAFFKIVLKNAVRELRLEENYIDPDPPNPKGLTVELFGERFRSLKRFGEILFNHSDAALFYLEDVALLKAHVNELSNGDQALAFARLYQSEHDPIRRLLKIIYTLNSRVGYRIADTVYPTPEELINAAFKNHQLFQTIYQHYMEGWLMSWLSAWDVDRFPNTGQRDALSFLKVVYRCGQSLPIYIDGKCYVSANELVQAADQDEKLRHHLYAHAEKGYLFIWAESRGWGHWRSLFKKSVQQLKASGLKDAELKLAALQELLRLMDVQRAEAKIAVDPGEISNLALPASDRPLIELTVELIAGAYAVVTLSLTGDLPGVSISPDKLIFNEWEGRRSAIVAFEIDALQMVKGVRYSGQLAIQSQQQELLVPLAFRSVFPVRAYLWGILRYAVFGFFFFGACRLLAVAFSGDQNRLPAGWYVSDLEKTLPTNYWAYFFSLIFTVAGLFAGYKMIRKYENI